ncbi:beta-1,4-galactosyltransferase galt-1-like [Dunckerocampus dactyliophorus]|uniref:beta-1,4-galactosyltransferase galt-1-like n=1 Tax=Dunckerocampus dactyliophorus TaxID=161453 RepID=UPI0024071B94|nr:beta-1,4-galactosyltransferase galt-1-like [Dunckerocampus dactyliophorus]XP_054639622.1 beta-1,4-galactosyltransferase galt-1-like [Dunckerocampus dactyliophorus]
MLFRGLTSPTDSYFCLRLRMYRILHWMRTRHRMRNANCYKWIVCVLSIVTFMVVNFILTRGQTSLSLKLTHPSSVRPVRQCPMQVSEETITPLDKTKHLLVSAYMDQRVPGLDVHIISIFKVDSMEPMECIFCCQGQMSRRSQAAIVKHPSSSAFPYITTYVMCQLPQGCQGSHVTIVPYQHQATVSNLMWIPVKNREKEIRLNFTVCISTMYGGYNNVLQTAQTLEIYRLLGVDKVVIYKTNSGPEVGRLLHSYIQEGFVEIVPWLIDKHLTPSSTWSFSKGAGDIRYFGQLTTLSECLYRSMERSRYVLMNDLDEIIMPHQHDSLMSMMTSFQQQNPNFLEIGEFRIKTFYFPTALVDPSKKFRLPQWEGVPGHNILEHIYSREYIGTNPNKLILQPRLVAFPNVHVVGKNFGQTYMVPPEVCRVIHVRTKPAKTTEQDEVNTRLWDFHQKLIPNVDRVLKRAGLLQ